MSRLHVGPSEGHSVVFWGLGTTYKVLSDVLGGSLGVVEHTLEPGWLGAPPHKHAREDETSYVLEGKLTVEQEGAVATAGPGEYILKPRGIFHSFWNAGTERVRFIEMISPGGFEHYFEELAPHFPPNAPQPDFQCAAAVAAKYGLEFDRSRVDELLAKYNLTAGRSPAGAASMTSGGQAPQS
ncbi:MAG: cupin domain-containing protein [Gemmatimonadaceae bacterium]